MDNIRNLFSLKAICTILTLSVFSITSATPEFIDRRSIVNEGILIYKIKKIKDMMRHFNHSTSNKEVIDTFLEVKQLVFEQTGNEINISDAISQAKSRMKSKGHSLDKKTWKSLEKMISKRESKFTSRIFYKSITEEAGQDFDENHFESIYEKIYGKDNDDSPISLEITLGVTFILCSVLMFAMPIPICHTIGAGFLEAGCWFLAGEGWEHIKDYTEK